MISARSMRAIAWAIALPMLGALAAPAGAAPKPTKGGDVIWIHPSYAEIGIPSIAFLPTASYDDNTKSEKMVESMFPQALRGSGYRWISPISSKDLIRSSLGESALTALDRGILKSARIDSLSANRVCRALRTAALLSTRVDLFEQIQVESNQSGKPSTTLQLHAALVDSTGRLLWSAAGSETAEGQYHDPTGAKSSGLDAQSAAGEAGAPSFDEVATRLFARWAAHFPSFQPAAARPATSPSPSPAASPVAEPASGKP
jgi:hypothetical protein